MADDQVQVQYVDQALAASNGTQPFKMGYELAEKWEAMGWVKILGRRPRANPHLSKAPLTITMPEEKNLTPIAWITAEYIDATIRKTGEKVGFRIDQVSPVTFTNQALMQAKIMVVESNIRGFTTNQLEDLRCIQFQKEIPFAFRVVGYDNSSSFRKSLERSKLNIFTTERLFNYVCEMHEDVIGNWMIEDKGDYFSFWRALDAVINPRSADIFKEAE